MQPTSALLATAFALALLAPAPRAQAPDDPAERALIESAAAVRPAPRQVAWQEREFLLFLHFGPNTFHAAEWGSGREPESLFHPTGFHPEQWIAVARSAGMRGVVITAKHHDGLCLWPSAYTSHDVSTAAWREGDVDVVGAVARACHEAGLAFGVYLSPADLHELRRQGGYYGNGSPARPVTIPSAGAAPGAPSFTFTVDDYNRYFLDQLYELLTRYGPVSEVWFDGANPEPGTPETYAYADWYALIRALAPDAVIAIKGPDVRWCGNEAGRARASEWSVIPLQGPVEQSNWPDMMAEDLGSLDRLRGAPVLHWYPAETDTSIRNGWFWREDEHVRSADDLFDLWTRTVGGNSVLLLNVPPNRAGRIDAPDVAALAGLGERLRATYGEDLARGAVATATDEAGPDSAAAMAVDDDPSTAWRTRPWTTRATLTLQLPEARTFDRIDLREPIATDGQRVAAFAVDARVGDAWKDVARATTIGHRRILTFPAVRSDAVRVRVEDARVSIALSTVALHLAPAADASGR